MRTRKRREDCSASSEPQADSVSRPSAAQATLPRKERMDMAKASRGLAESRRPTMLLALRRGAGGGYTRCVKGISPEEGRGR
ncbi:hypothetical protein KH5H1_49360 [Corallococcus caeni]|nr:hypothetical protein KH5H1_49360 [Corallococcus sp. KH5-1]